MKHIINRINSAIRILLGRGVVVNDEYINGVHIIHTKLRDGGGILRCEHIESFGDASRAPIGSEVIVGSFGGKRAQTVVLMAHNREYKFELQVGEKAIYNQFGDFVHLKESGEVHVKARTKVYAETPLFETSGDCLVQGNLQVNGTTRLLQDTSVESGNFLCSAASAFLAPSGFAAGISNQGIDIGKDHQHTNGGLPSAPSGGVV